MKKGKPKDYNTGETIYDLPSPYEPHISGLLHLKRFIARARVISRFVGTIELARFLDSMNLIS